MTERESSKEAKLCLKVATEAIQVANIMQGIKELRTGRTLFQQRGLETSKVYLKISNCQAQACFEIKQYEPIVEICGKVLQMAGNSPHKLELLQTLFFFANAHYLLHQQDLGYELVN